MNVELIERRPEAKNIFSFWFKKPAGYKHNAGEYLEMSLDFKNADERGNRHWFTIAASPSEDLLMHCTKFPAEGQQVSTFKQHLMKLNPGDTVQISPPMGDFILPKNPEQKLVLVAGGIGVTPFRSMAKFLSDQKEARPVQLLYAANSADEFVFTDLLDGTPGWQVTRMVGEASSDWKGPTGRLDGAKIAELADGLDDKLVYISGPEPMVKSLRDQLVKAGHSKHQVKIDDFPGYTDI